MEMMSDLLGSERMSSRPSGNGDSVMIPRPTFTRWLDNPRVLAMLQDVDIEIGTRFELFDVLDVDMGGDLSIDELVEGLLWLRGPVSKTEIAETRMKVRYMTRLVESMWLEVWKQSPTRTTGDCRSVS